jgi:integrase/recombinase XerD
MELPGKEYLHAYLKHQLRRNFRRQTIVQTLSTLSFFLAFLGQRGTCIERLARQDLEAFIEGEQDRGLKVSSVDTKLDRIYGFLGFLVEDGVVPSEIQVRRIRLKVPDSLPRAMDPEDVKKLLSVIKDIPDRAMILVLLRTGMRISELLALKPSDVNARERTITIREGAKTRQGRIVYLSSDAQNALVAWLQERDTHKERLFYTRARTTFCYTTARHLFNKYLKEAGLVHQGHTLHCLRHTFASELLNAGMRLECLQQLLGHQSVQVTRHYARLTNITVQQEYFRAMRRIERGKIHGTYRADHKLQTILKAKRKLPAYGQKLYGGPKAVSGLAGQAD